MFQTHDAAELGRLQFRALVDGRQHQDMLQKKVVQPRGGAITR